MQLIECVPNISEGRNKEIIDAIVKVLRDVEEVKLLDVCMDADHNRTVLTFVGPQKAVEKGAEVVSKKVFELIDMTRHKGAHPRMGAIDVIPFVPLRGATMDDAVKSAYRFGYTLGEKYKVPVYFYGEAARDPRRRELSWIRKGGYEALKERLRDTAWEPDAGPAIFNPRIGAVAVGAREPLIAFNINLASNNLQIAKNIAFSIRESSGGLPCVKAIGVHLESRNNVQVSINLTNYKKTSLKEVFDRVRDLAAQQGVEIAESEIVGLVPEGAMKDVTPEYLKLSHFSPERIIEAHL